VGEVELGVELAVDQAGDAHPLEFHREGVEHVEQQPMRQPPGGRHFLGGYAERHRFGPTDPDRQVSALTVAFLQQQHRLAAARLGPHPSHLELRHTFECPPSPAPRPGPGQQQVAGGHQGQVGVFELTGAHDVRARLRRPGTAMGLVFR